MSEHTPECIETMKQALWEEWLYTSRWPRYCKACSGWGQVSWWESPDGHGGYQMSDICSECVGGGICPRCGHAGIWAEGEVDLIPCPVCKWTENDPGKPYGPDECGCFDPFQDMPADPDRDLTNPLGEGEFYYDGCEVEA